MTWRERTLGLLTLAALLAVGIGFSVALGSFLAGFGTSLAIILAVLAVLALIRRQSSGGRRTQRGHAHAGPRF